MAKRKRQKDKTLHRKLNIDQHKPHKKKPKYWPTQTPQKKPKYWPTQTPPKKPKYWPTQTPQKTLNVDQHKPHKKNHGSLY